MIANREPSVLFISLVQPLVVLLSAWLFPMTDEQQSLVNAAAAAVIGFVAAAFVSVDKALPLLTGVAQAVLAVGMGFGLEMDPEVQSAILAVVGLASGYFVRTQVVPKASPVAPVYRDQAVT